MNWKEKFLSATIYSIKFKLIAAVVVVQLFSSYIGQLVNLGISKGRASLEKIGFGTSFFDGTVGVVITTMISLVISVFIIVFIYDSLVLKRKNIYISDYFISHYFINRNCDCIYFCTRDGGKQFVVQCTKIFQEGNESIYEKLS